MVKCDEGHNIVVVVPSSSDTFRIFWTGSEHGYSPLVCQQVQLIHARGESLLPLGDGDQDILHAALARIPDGVGDKGLFVLEHGGERGVEVLVFSFSGSRINRVLTLLLQRQMGDNVQVRYNDFVVKILRAGKAGAGERVASAVRGVQAMHPEEIGAILPIPPAGQWKFARAIPDQLVHKMALSDHYHLEEFMQSLGLLTVTVLDHSLPCSLPHDP
jgi:hypothetical protein